MSRFFNALNVASPQLNSLCELNLRNRKLNCEFNLASRSEISLMRKRRCSKRISFYSSYLSINLAILRRKIISLNYKTREGKSAGMLPARIFEIKFTIKNLRTKNYGSKATLS